ncbi:MAG: penicillin-insensitive murein endopeptidase [Myxococcota bacterium]
MSNQSDDELQPETDDPALDSGSDDAGEAHAEGDIEESEAPEPRSRIGVILFASAGALWGLFGMMRCDRDDGAAPPSAAVAEAEVAEPAAELPAPPEPSDVDVIDETPEAAGKPEPAAETPDVVDVEPDVEDEPDLPTPAGFDPRPEPAAWARGFKAPTSVKYTVRRGGSIKNVANLYKIFHHEIEALNPGVSLEQDLPPQSGVVVYKADGADKSESVGVPSNGSLEGGVPMVDGPGRVMKMIGWKSFATANTVAVLDGVLRQWAKTGHKQPVIVGNMSSRSGGRLKPHSTHQSGRDVDLGYPQILPAGEELNWRVMNSRNLDAKENWALLSMLVQTGQVEVVYIDREIQKLLYEYAVKQNLMSKGALKKWMEYPAPTGSGSPVIQHVNGHVDHMHVRFNCQPHETRCKSRHR